MSLICVVYFRTASITIILSLYLGKKKTPIPAWSRKKGCRIIWYPFHQVFAVRMTTYSLLCLLELTNPLLELSWSMTKPTKSRAARRLGSVFTRRCISSLVCNASSCRRRRQWLDCATGHTYLSRDMTKPTKWVHPAKTQISLGIRPVWSESTLCTQWVAKDPRFLHADSEDSDQTGCWSESSLGAHSFCWFCHVAVHFIGFVLLWRHEKNLVLVWFLFYGPSTHFRSFWVRSVNLATLFLGKPPRQFTST